VQTVHSSRWIKNIALTICVLWIVLVLGVGAAVYFHKPWGHDPFVRPIAGQLAHCNRPAIESKPQPASYDWREIAKCAPGDLVAPLEPTHEFMYGPMLVTTFAPPLLLWLLAYIIAGITRLAVSRQSRGTT
jgi:hypothetical protein